MSGKTRFRHLQLLLAALCWLLLTSACSAPTLSAPAREAGLRLHDLGPVSSASPLAWAPDGHDLLAVSGHGLERFARSGGPATLLAAGPATACAWAPDGGRLAVARAQGEQTRLQILDPDGQVRATTELPGKVPFLYWGTNGLNASLVELTHYTFGTRYLLEWVRWSGNGPPERMPLWDVTLKPRTPVARQEAALAVSPAGDEVAFVEIHDPPARAAYRRLVLYRPEASGALPLAERQTAGGPGTWLGDGETLLLAGSDGIVAASPRLWPRRQVVQPGTSLAAASPGGRHLVVDGQLFVDGWRLGALPPLQAAAFSADGSGLALISNGRLLVIEGLDADPGPAPPADLTGWLALRTWWAEGLIDNDDYQQKYRELLP